MLINVIVGCWTLFYTENCVRLSGLFVNGIQGRPETQQTDIGQNGHYGGNRCVGPSTKTPARKNYYSSTFEVYNEMPIYFSCI